MVDGPLDKLRIGAIIQARMKSSRLPGKILLPLPFADGKPLLSWIVEGVRRSRYVNQVVLATSLESENDCLETFSVDYNVPLFRGSEDDVLSRFVAVIKEHNFDIVIRLTGDNPIVDVKTLDEAIEYHISSKRDYTKTSGLPIGTNFEIVSGHALVQLQNYDLTLDDREHVTLFLRRTDFFKKSELQLCKDDNFSHVRLTVDYPSDFAALSVMLSLAKNGVPDLAFIKEVRLSHDWIFNINADNIQRQQFSTEHDEINNAIGYLEQIGMNRAALILKKNALP
jgi:spore coat polysaccharide biosynthesis protein SpsF